MGMLHVLHDIVLPLQYTAYLRFATLGGVGRMHASVGAGFRHGPRGT